MHSEVSPTRTRASISSRPWSRREAPRFFLTINAITHGESKLIFGWPDVIFDVSQMRGHMSSPSIMRFSNQIT